VTGKGGSRAALSFGGRRTIIGNACQSEKAMTTVKETQLQRLLGMKPHPKEGGYFVETYRSGVVVEQEGYPGQRSLCTAIYYMLTATSFSALHKVTGDEIFHFYAGDAVEMLQLFPDGSSDLVTLGPEPLSGMKFQHLVAGGVWQGARLVKGGQYALLGTTMAPGFDFEDYTTGDREELIARYPDRAGLISQLVR
jgi:predicted cupin superfamily sugar epimerase